jgi:hypothetical protein
MEKFSKLIGGMTNDELLKAYKILNTEKERREKNANKS